MSAALEPQLLLDWFDQTARDLPWRRPEATPWGVLVSEIMLQQTPVSRVLPAYAAWLKRWPEPSALAAASPADAVRQWGRLGKAHDGARCTLANAQFFIARCHGFFALKTRPASSGGISSNGFMPAMRT